MRHKSRNFNSSDIQCPNCNYCDFKAAYQWGIKAHMKMCHTNESVLENIGEPFKCTQ